MSNTELIARMQELISLEPSLKEELQKARSLDQVLQHLQSAANRHDIPLDAGELDNMLEAVNAKAKAGELTDEQLAQVEGGSGWLLQLTIEMVCGATNSIIDAFDALDAAKKRMSGN